jgi:cell division protein YceG involved in septum cleavage
MSKINNIFAVFLVFLLLIVLMGLHISPNNMIKHTQKPEVSGLSIRFENETTEPEVKSILENHNMTVSYSIFRNS